MSSLNDVKKSINYIDQRKLLKAAIRRSKFAFELLFYLDQLISLLAFDTSPVFANDLGLSRLFTSLKILRWRILILEDSLENNKVKGRRRIKRLLKKLILEYVKRLRRLKDLAEAKLPSDEVHNSFQELESDYDMLANGYAK